MFEKFEIKIVSEDIADISGVIDELQVKPNLFVTTSDWDFSDKTEIDPEMINSINTLLQNDKIVIVEGKSRGVYCGVFMSKNKVQKYEYDIWFSADAFDGLTKNGITDKNKFVYDRITSLIKKYFDTRKMFFCAMGVEMYIGKGKEINEIVAGSVGAFRWLIPSKENIVDKIYTEEPDGGLKMYSLYLK